MSLFGGDLTTPARVTTWLANPPTLPSAIINQLITSMSTTIVSKLNRGRLYSRSITRTFDGVGNAQLLLPDYPVTGVSTVQVGQSLVRQSVLVPSGVTQPQNTSPGYGYRFVAWNGDLPGDPSMLEFASGFFGYGPQVVQVTYQAGYLIQNEPGTVPGTGPYTVTTGQPLGIWCRDNGVMYADGTLLTSVTTLTGAGQYIPPPDATPGLYTFDIADAGANILISYSFVPADLEEATIQMVAERMSYRNRVGELSKSLGGQETVSFLRGGRSKIPGLPPEVGDMVWPYVSVIAPAIGAPV